MRKVYNLLMGNYMFVYENSLCLKSSNRGNFMQK